MVLLIFTFWNQLFFKLKLNLFLTILGIVVFIYVSFRKFCRSVSLKVFSRNGSKCFKNTSEYLKNSEFHQSNFTPGKCVFPISQIFWFSKCFWIFWCFFEALRGVSEINSQRQLSAKFSELSKYHNQKVENCQEHVQFGLQKHCLLMENKRSKIRLSSVNNFKNPVIFARYKVWTTG